MSSPAYMVISVSRTTRASTSTSTFPAPTRFKARVQTETVAPVVNTWSTSKLRRLKIRGAAHFVMVNALATLRRRARADRPPRAGVRCVRLSASTMTGVTDRRQIACKSQPTGLICAARPGHCGGARARSGRLYRPACGLNWSIQLARVASASRQPDRFRFSTAAGRTYGHRTKVEGKRGAAGVAHGPGEEVDLAEFFRHERPFF
jgi:hypothetical protein